MSIFLCFGKCQEARKLGRAIERKSGREKDRKCRETPFLMPSALPNLRTYRLNQAAFVTLQYMIIQILYGNLILDSRYLTMYHKQYDVW